nr:MULTISPECIES: hypothetical protein [unclassified Caballeronia]
MAQRIRVKNEPVNYPASRLWPDTRHACIPAMAALLDESEEIGERMDTRVLKSACSCGLKPARNRVVRLRGLDQTGLHASEGVDLTPAQAGIPG